MKSYPGSPQMAHPPAADHGIDQQRKGVNTHMLITYFRSLLALLVNDEKGQTAIEYALVLALIAVVIVGVVAAALQLVVPSIMTDITNKL
jgi:Flp pilus assembly pilin Flp